MNRRDLDVALGPELLDEVEGPALRLGAAESQRLLRAVLSDIASLEQAVSVAKQTPTNTDLHLDAGDRTRRGGRVLPLYHRPTLLVAGVLIAASAAAAVVVSSRSGPAPQEPAAPLSKSVSTGEAQRGLSRPALAPPADPVVSPTTSRPIPRSEPERAPGFETKKVRAPSRRPNSGSRLRAKAPSEVAADLLSQASALRRRRDYQGALATYLSITKRYPGTRQAQVAAIAAASLELEHFGQVDEAQRHYAEASRGQVSTSAEALLGLADTARVRGDSLAERAALRRLLRGYPSSPLARGVRDRLKRLEDDSQ